MRKRKKREYQSSELVKKFAKIYGFEDKLLALEIKDYLREYLDKILFDDIESVNLNRKTLLIKVTSPLLKTDLRMRRSFYLQKFQNEFGKEKLEALEIL